jgi:hypothetical protein
MMGMTEFFLIHDTIYQHEALKDTVSSGRFLLGVFGSLSSDLHIPWINGLIILIFIALTSAAVVSLFDIKDKFTAGLISALMTVTPTIGYFIIYSFAGDAYAFALFCSVFALLLTKRYKFGFIPGIILFCVSLAIYQAFIMFAISACVLIVFCDAISNNINFKYYGRLIITGGGGVLLYLIVNYLILNVLNTDIASYQNIDSLVSIPRLISLFNFSGSIAQMYSILVTEKYLIGFGNIGIIALVSILTLCFITISIIYKNFNNLNKSIVDKKTRSHFLINTLIAVISILALTIALNIMSPLGQGYYHKMMQQQYILIPVGFVIIINNYKDYISHVIIKRIAAVAAILLVFTLTVRVNVGYTKFHDMSVNVHTQYCKVADAIEHTEGFRDGMDTRVLSYGYAYYNGEYFRPGINTNAIKEYLRLYEGIHINIIKNEKDFDSEEFIKEHFSEVGVCDTVVIDDILYVYIDQTGVNTVYIYY